MYRRITRIALVRSTTRIRGDKWGEGRVRALSQPSTVGGSPLILLTRDHIDRQSYQISI